MSEDLSNRSTGNRLPRRRILRGKDSFELLFQHGSRIAGRFVDLRYRMHEETAPDFRVAFIAGRKMGNAVKRNRGKRLLREAFRLQQHILDPVVAISARSLHLAIMLKRHDAEFRDIKDDVSVLLKRLNAQLTPHG
jgi:ribonuclease P protein component